MDHTRLGRTGLQVSKLCLGTMTFGLQCDEQTSVAILDRSAEGGIDFIDTSDAYPLGGDSTTQGAPRRSLGAGFRENAIVSSSRPNALLVQVRLLSMEGTPGSMSCQQWRPRFVACRPTT